MIKKQFARVMLAGTHSGCGKTTVTCAVLQALAKRGLSLASFKCGPDYIDPLFHSKVLGVPSRNLDRFFTDKERCNQLFAAFSGDKDLSVVEGVMGYYDGAGDAGSSCQLSLDTKTPAVLVVDAKGMSQSLGALISGFLKYRENRIRGVIFNRLPGSMEEFATQLCVELGVCYLGYLPVRKDCQFESRHLGLVTADEIEGIREQMQALAIQAEKTVRLDRLIELANDAEPLNISPEMPLARKRSSVRLGLARDHAFCFHYADNYTLLESLGCEIVPFSPLTDISLPEGIDGLWLGGGYPELYAGQLSLNTGMLQSVASAIADGLPTVAECGGFLYLHRQLTDRAGKSHSMAGVIAADAYPMDHLTRFGYIRVTAGNDNLLCRQGEQFPSHEFHYWESSAPGNHCTAEKPSGARHWPCIHASETLFAGFPHIYLNGNPRLAERLTGRMAAYQSEKRHP